MYLITTSLEMGTVNGAVATIIYADLCTYGIVAIEEYVVAVPCY